MLQNAVQGPKGIDVLRAMAWCLYLVRVRARMGIVKLIISPFK